MAEHIVEMTEFVCFGGNIQQLPTGEIREEIVRCRDCKYCREDDSVYVCDQLDFTIDYNNGKLPDGFCYWGERK